MKTLKPSQIGILSLGLIVAFVIGLAVGKSMSNPNVSSSSPNQDVGCTQEAKLCPDGSAVGRTNPNCQFPDCPDQPPATQP